MEQLSIIDNITNSEEQSLKKSTRDAFACCSRYRECSQAKKCLIPEKDYSINCTYRENLERNNIFFGKNANDFDASFYNEILNIYNNLEDDVRQELNCIIVYFKKFNTMSLLYNSEAVNKLIEYKFLVYVPAKNDKRELLPKLKANFLRGFLPQEAKDNLDAQAKIKNGPRARANRKEIVEYLISHDIPAVDEYIKKFIYIAMSHKRIRYMHELYYDFLCGKENEFKIKLPKHYETNFLKGTVL